MEYKLIRTCFVNDSLAKGWRLYGYPIKGEAHFFQAMTRNFTEPFRVVTGIEGEWNAAAEMCEKYGYYPIGEPQKTGELIEVAGEQLPEFAVILMKKEG
jgi:hypothetical protein